MSSTALTVIEHQLAPLRPMFEQLLRPTGLPAERLIRTVLISCDQNPRLLDCTPMSVIQAATTGAVLGLECDGVTGQGFLVPLSAKGVLKAQWWTGYRGFNTLGARVGLTINGGIAREGDEFDFEEGSNGFVRHKKLLGAGRNRSIIAAWATATAPDRSAIVCVMDLDEILAIKKRSPAVRAGRDTPWNDQEIGFPAMAEKTPKRRLARSLPLTAYAYHQAARVDEASEEQGRHAFIHPERGIVIEGEADRVEEARDAVRGPAIPMSRPVFLVRQLDDRELRCTSIEQWRAAIVEAAQSISTDDVARRFRDMNASAIEEYARDHPDAADAVAAAFARRLGPASPGGPAEAAVSTGMAAAGPSPAADRTASISQRSGMAAADTRNRTAATRPGANPGGRHVAEPREPPLTSAGEAPSPGSSDPSPASPATDPPPSPRPRTEWFWAQDELRVRGATSGQIEFELRQFLAECRDQLDVNGLEKANEGKIQALPRATREDVVAAIEARRAQLPFDVRP